MSARVEDHEKAIEHLEAQIERLDRTAREQGVDRSAEIQQLKVELEAHLRAAYQNPTGWIRTKLARNPQRPFTLDVIRLLFDDFLELHGDRLFGDDGAMVGGIARIDSEWVVVIGQQKGRDALERHRRNFGMAKPEGYRKALRLMRLAEKFRRPVVAIIDTPAADCTVPSEERGISESIARNMQEMFLLRTPIVALILGEGGSGGAIGIGVADRVLMLENAIYSVIPPEGCAAIIWKDPRRGEEAAEALQLTAAHAREQGAVDEVLPEPLGGAHRDWEATVGVIAEALARHLADLQALPPERLLEERYRRFRNLGVFGARPEPGDGPDNRE